jgi:hypothetical protein
MAVVPIMVACIKVLKIQHGSEEKVYGNFQKGKAIEESKCSNISLN